MMSRLLKGGRLWCGLVATIAVLIPVTAIAAIVAMIFFGIPEVRARLLHADQLTIQQARGVQVGMDRSQVEEILGSPRNATGRTYLPPIRVNGMCNNYDHEQHWLGRDILIAVAFDKNGQVIWVEVEKPFYCDILGQLDW
jgi:hypothetical protein